MKSIIVKAFAVFFLTTSTFAVVIFADCKQMTTSELLREHCQR